jgi:hypothetical protein
MTKQKEERHTRTVVEEDDDTAVAPREKETMREPRQQYGRGNSARRHCANGGLQSPNPNPSRESDDFSRLPVDRPGRATVRGGQKLFFRNQVSQTKLRAIIMPMKIEELV